MLKELLQECHMTQETVAEQAAMHRSTVARIINVPEAAHPQMIMRFAETFGVLKNHVMRWYCLEACPLGKACQSTEFLRNLRGLRQSRLGCRRRVWGRRRNRRVWGQAPVRGRGGDDGSRTASPKTGPTRSLRLRRLCGRSRKWP